MGDRIKFSIEGMTIRGFFEHMRHWVPFKGERLQCDLTEDGPVAAFKERQNVGNIAKEFSKQCRDWLKAGGTLESVVVTITPKMHRTKGDEVAVIYGFSGMKNPQMTNLKNSIEIDIQKKKKRKKSLAFHTGDITDSMEMETPDNSLLSRLDQTSQLDFSVLGKSLRGFHVYIKKWVPEIGKRHECFVSRQGAVAAKFGEEEVCGHVPTDIQKPWKRYLKENGQITAVVADSPKRHKSKGMEVPMIYVFTAEWTPILKNLRRIIIADIGRKMKRCKSLKVQSGDATSELRTKGHMTEARGSHVDSDDETANDEQENNANEPPLQTARGSRKRRLNEDNETNETERSKKKKKKHSSKSDKAGQFSTKKMDRKIKLNEKDFYKISKMIGKNWKLLGLELGLKHTDISHVVMDNRNSGVTFKIFRMLLKFSEVTPENATLRYLIEAVNECSELEIDHEGFKKFIKENRSK